MDSPSTGPSLSPFLGSEPLTKNDHDQMTVLAEARVNWTSLGCRPLTGREQNPIAVNPIPALELHLQIDHALGARWTLPDRLFAARTKPKRIASLVG